MIPCEQLGWLDWLIRLIPKSSSTVVSGCEELKSAGDGSWLHFESEGRGFDSLRARYSNPWQRLVLFASVLRSSGVSLWAAWDKDGTNGAELGAIALTAERKSSTNRWP